MSTGPIGYSRLFDFSDPSQVLEAIELIEQLDSVYTGLGDNLSAKFEKLKQNESKLVEIARSLKQSIENSNDVLKKNNTTILKNEEVTEALLKTQKDVKNEIKEVSEQIKKNTDEQDKFKKSKENLTKLQQDEIKLTEKLNELNSEQAIENAKLRVQIQEKNKAVKEAAKESLDLVSAYQRESRRLNDLRKQYKDAALLYGENSEAAEKLRLEAIELDEVLKRIDKNVGQGQRSVGLYAEALEEAGISGASFTEAMKDLSDSLNDVGDKLETVGGSVGGVIGGIKSLSTSIKALLANPLVLTLAVIIGSLKLLFDAFKRSAVGSKLFADAGAVVDGVITTLTSVVTQLADFLTPLFENPQEGLKSLINLLKDQLINRFKAVIKFTQLVGKAFSQLINRDIEGLKDTLGEAGKAFVQFQTGLDERQQAKIVKGFKDLTDEVQKNVEAFRNLEKARRSVRIQNRELERSTFSLIAAEEQLELVRDDATRGFLEREAAAELFFKVSQERAEAELTIARNRLNLVNQEVNIRRAAGEEIQDLLDEQLDRQRELEDAERSFTNTVLTNEKERRQLVQDRLERDLDFAIDAFDNQKTNNEKLINNERLTLSQRRAILEETRRLADQSFLRQEEILTELSNAQVDATELLKLDALALTERVRELEQSEIVEGRTLEVIRERRTVLSDLQEATEALDEVERQRDKRELEASQAIQDLRIESFIAQKDLETQFGKNRLDALKSRISAELKFAKIQADRLLENENLTAQERFLIQEQLEKQLSEITKKGAQDRKKIRQEEVDFAIQSGLEILSSAQEFADKLFSNNQENFDRELEASEEREQQQLEKEGLNEEARAAIQQRFAEEREKIRERQIRSERRQAILSKAIAAVEIVANTGTAILKAVAASPLTGGLPFSAIVGTIGALQLATVLAQPIPQFAKGTKSAPRGPAIVDEEGPEIIYNPRTGQIDFGKNEGPRMVDLEGGEVILNSIISDRIRRESRRPVSEINNEGFAASERNLRNFEKAQMYNDLGPLISQIAGIPVTQFNVKFGELNKSIRKGNTVYESVESENRVHDL